jgi:hypothetical protein
VAPNSGVRKEISGLLSRARWGAPLFSLVVAASFLYLPPHWPSLFAGIGLGVGAFLLAILSWKHYHPWFSWAIWVIPTAAGFAAIMGHYGASGEASVLHLFFQAAWAGLAVFLLLAFLLRRKLMQWI